MGDVTGFEPFARVAIIGVGLMGGSLGLALRSRGLAGLVVGIDECPDTVARARDIGAIAKGTTDLAEGVRDADCVVVAAPVGAIVNVLQAIAPHVASTATITDLGSTKIQIVAEGLRLFGPRFVGGHPMAGAERSGIGAADRDLFEGAAWAIVRPGRFDLSDDPFAARVAGMVEALNARPVLLEAEQHDRIVAIVSHLPHLLSFAYSNAVEASAEAVTAREMAGGSYRDLMRVSQADSDLWGDIFRQNREFLRSAITTYEAELKKLKRSFDLDQQT